MESKVLFENAYYSVCITKAGLSVQNRKTNKGICLPPHGKDYATWVNSFNNTMDKSEANYLAKCFLTAAS